MEMKNTFIAVMMACLPLLSQAQTTVFTCWKTNGQQMKLAAEEMLLTIPDTVAAIDLRDVEAITHHIGTRQALNRGCTISIV